MTLFVVHLEEQRKAPKTVTGTFEELWHEQGLTPVEAHLAVLQGENNGTEDFFEYYRLSRAEWRETATEAEVDFEDLQLRLAELALERGDLRVTSVEFVDVAVHKCTGERQVVQNVHYELTL